MKVLLIFGGASPEHEVSIRSAITIHKSLSIKHDVTCAYITKEDVWCRVPSPENLQDYIEMSFDPVEKKWEFGEQAVKVDVAFPIVHGVGGEDGVLQTKLSGWGIKFVGTPAEESEICFDKRATKELLRASGINVVEEIILMKSGDRTSFEDSAKQLGGDILFVKPSRSGSSVGVHKVKNQEELTIALDDAFQFDDTVLVERAVSSPRELEVAVLETSPGIYEASKPGEIVPDDDFYSYEAKYAATSQSKTDVNPDLPEDLKNDLSRVSLKANEVLGCRGLVRVDFLYDGEKQVLYLNEVNTLPGFTSISMYPMLWANSGLQLDDLIDKLVTVAEQS